MKNYNFKIAGYCETDYNASKAYSAIHNVPESMNLRDVAKLNMGKLPYKCTCRRQSVSRLF